MGLFSSIAGAVAGPLIGGLLGREGDDRAERDVRRSSQAVLQAAQPFNVSGPGGQANFQDGRLTTGLDGGFQSTFGFSNLIGRQALGDLSRLPFEQREQHEFDRLQRLRQPSIAAARAGLQERLFNRGRTGFGRGGGLTGSIFNPESAALEEAIMRSQLSDVGAARDLSQGQQSFLLGQAERAQGLSQRTAGFPLAQAQVGLNARNPFAGVAGQGDLVSARSNQGFFNSLGNQLGSLDLGGVFTGGGSFNQVDPRIFEGDTGGP